MSATKITPFLWFNGRIDEAVKFYTGIFKNSTVESISGPNGNAMSATFELEGQRFHAFNGGPMFKFNESVSFMVNCETQEEIDYYWNGLTTGGEESRCGWLKDPFGLSWQIIPSRLTDYLGNPDPEKAKKAMDAMMQMNKMEIAKFEEAVR